MDKAKKAKASDAETKATAEGDLAIVSKGLAEDIAQLAATHQQCMSKATEFETSTKSRAEELKALAEAKKIILEMTSGATSQTYDLAQVGASLLQTRTSTHLSSRADLANFEAVKFVKRLAQKLGSSALMQLANRMAATARLSAATGDDPFAKVKALISEMIERLLKEAEEDATHKAYCDKEMSETKAKKEHLTDEIDGLTTKIDSKKAASAKLKEEVAVLSKELADLAASQHEMDKLRAEEKAAFQKEQT